MTHHYIAVKLEFVLLLGTKMKSPKTSKNKRKSSGQQEVKGLFKVLDESSYNSGGLESVGVENKTS